jgi:hypothetical protein
LGGGIQFHKFKLIAIVGATAHNCINTKRMAHNWYGELGFTVVPVSHPLTNIPATASFTDIKRRTTHNFLFFPPERGHVDFTVDLVPWKSPRFD